MAIQRITTAPSINFTETDATFNNPSIANGTALGIVGEFEKGRAFEPIEINSQELFERTFGTLNPCKFEDSNQVKYEGAYIARQYLSEGDLLKVVRTLGLSGYDAGDAWGIQLGANVDENTIGQSGSTTDFTLSVQYVNGNVNRVSYNDSTLQKLYEEGYISPLTFGGTDVETGSTITQNKVFMGDCESFTGASYKMTINSLNQDYICLTGSTTVNETNNVTTETQTCEVLYSGGTITYNSEFYINVSNPIVITNPGTNEIYEIQPSTNAVIYIQGGIITHDSDNAITIENSTITLPNGTILSGGTFNICDFNGNEAYYNCDIDPSSINYQLTSGTTTITQPVTVGSTQQYVTQIPSGIINVEFSGTVSFFTGSPIESIDGTIVAMMRSTANYSSDETLAFDVEGNVMSITSLDGGVIRPLDDFRLSFYDRNGKTYEYITSLDRTKSNYLPRIFGSFQLCCKNNLPIYIEEYYQIMLERMIENNEIHCIKPSVCFLSELDNYQEKYRGAYSPWVVSELQGSVSKRLFRVHSFSDGNVANTDIKISIENIDLSKSTFDLIVRSFSDTDKRPTILESYRRLTLREDSNNFIGRRIGTTDGNYQMQGNYIMIELASDCQASYVPAGFEGYPIRDYSCGKAPRIEYKTSYNSFDRKRNVYLGLSENLGFDSDFFTYKGMSNNTDIPMWTGTTNGFHLDKDAASIEVDGVLRNFDVGNASFKNEVELVGTDYERKNARKFTFALYGGFDGWDIHRKRRTNTDDYDVRGSAAQQAILSGALGEYSDLSINDGAVVNNSDYYAYLKGIRTFSNKDQVFINLLTTPNVNTLDNSNLIEDTIDMIEQERCDVLYIVTTPDMTDDGEMYSAEDIQSLLDGLYDSSYVATYWPWGQYNDVVNNVRVWIPPTAEVVRNFTITDKIARPWFATANRERGTTQFIQSRKILSTDERGILDEARVNVVTELKSYGVTEPTIYSQRTMQIDDSKLQDINVRRLMIYLQREIQIAVNDLLFEPNDEEIRTNFDARVRPILDDVRDQRGIQNYRVQTTILENEADSRTLSSKIFILPIGATKYIDIDFVLTKDTQSFE